MNVLIVSGGGFQGFSLLRALELDPRIHVVVADIYDQNVSHFFAHRARKVPPLSDARAFSAALRAICAEEQIDVVFPATQRELWALATEKASGGLGKAAIASPPSELLGCILDKLDLHHWLTRHGLPRLDTVPFEGHGDASIGFPAIAKARQGWGGIGTLVLRSDADCEQLVPTSGPGYVLQRFLENIEEVSVDFAIDFAGQLSPLFMRKRVRVSGGFAVITESVRHAPVEATVRKLALALASEGATGLFNVQLLLQAGQHYITDLNPRFGTSSGFSLGLGVSLPLFVCASLDRGVCFVYDTPHGATATRMVRSLTDLQIPLLPALRQCRGVVFDLDDTLLDHKAWIARKLALLYEEQGAQLGLDKTAFLSAGLWALERNERAELLDVIVAELGLSQATRDVLLDAYRRLTPQTFEPYADVRAVLSELRARGKRVAILTDNPPQSQAQKLAVLGLRPLVDAVAFSREHGAEKPAASAFVAAARALECEPEALCMVGDDLFRDIAGSLQAGFSHAFLIRREGAFGNAAPALVRELLGADFVSGRFSTISSLREIVHALAYAGDAEEAHV